MKLTFTSILLVLAGAFCTSIVNAQAISVTPGALTYTQNFNTLGSPSTSTALTIAGWQLVELGTGGAADNLYIGGTGSNNGGNAYSFGTQNSTERSLGGIQSGTVVPYFGAAFQNNTGSTVTSMDVQYTGEQWRVGSTSFHIDSLVFEYSLTASGVGDIQSSWTAVSALVFESPVTTIGTAGNINGNNNDTVKTATVPVSIPDGATFRMRWRDVNIVGSDDGLGIDDFSVTFTAGPAVVNIIATGMPICPGGSVGFTANIPQGTTPSLQWRTNGQPVPGATGNVFVYTSASAGDIVDLFVTPNGGTPYTTNAITVTGYPSLTWIGGSGNNFWSNPANWTCGVVPTAADNVTIPASATVVVNANADCLNLNVAASANISFSGPGAATLHAHGTMQNAGTINVQEGTLQVDEP